MRKLQVSIALSAATLERVLAHGARDGLDLGESLQNLVARGLRSSDLMMGIEARMLGEDEGPPPYAPPPGGARVVRFPMPEDGA